MFNCRWTGPLGSSKPANTAAAVRGLDSEFHSLRPSEPKCQKRGKWVFDVRGVGGKGYHLKKKKIDVFSPIEPFSVELLPHPRFFRSQGKTPINKTDLQKSRFLPNKQSPQCSSRPPSGCAIWIVLLDQAKPCLSKDPENPQCSRHWLLDNWVLYLIYHPQWHQ